MGGQVRDGPGAFWLGIFFLFCSTTLGAPLVNNLLRYTHRKQEEQEVLDTQGLLARDQPEAVRPFLRRTIWISAIFFSIVDILGEELGGALVGQCLFVPINVGMALIVNPLMAKWINEEFIHPDPDILGGGVIALGLLIVLSSSERDVPTYVWDDLVEKIKEVKPIVGLFWWFVLMITSYILIWTTSQGGEEAYGLFPRKDARTTWLTKLCYPFFVGCWQALEATLVVTISFMLWGWLDAGDDDIWTKFPPYVVYGLAWGVSCFVHHIAGVALERVEHVDYMPCNLLSFMTINMVLAENIWGELGGYSIGNLAGLLFGLTLVVSGGVYISITKANENRPRQSIPVLARVLRREAALQARDETRGSGSQDQNSASAGLNFFHGGAQYGTLSQDDASQAQVRVPSSNSRMQMANAWWEYTTDFLKRVFEYDLPNRMGMPSFAEDGFQYGVLNEDAEEFETRL